MVIYQYDKTLEGFLTAVFHAYARKVFPDRLIGEGELPPLFCEEVFHVYTDEAKADRVWKGLERKAGSREMLAGLAACWLSELPEVDMLLFRYVRKLFDYRGNFSFNLGDADVLQVVKIWKKVNQERLRVIQFLRFQQTADGIYFAALKPLYNVLPLTLPHLTDRFADQPWLLYDLKREYGYYYDLQEAREVRFDEKPSHLVTGKLDEALMGKDEKAFQQMWQTYFHSIAIKERLNPRLHRQNMPVRFWRYLTEKETDDGAS